MKPIVIALLAIFALLLTGCATTPKSGLADRSATPCQKARGSNLKFNKDADGFEDSEQAIKLLSACLASWPEAPAAYRSATLTMRAIAYAQQKNYVSAIADREEALRLMPPRTGWDIIGLATCYRDSGQPERAVELLRKMLQDHLGLQGKGTTPGMPSYYHLGRALIGIQQWSEAAEAFSEGLNYQTDYAWAFAYRSVAYDRLNQTDLARADIDKARSLIATHKPSEREQEQQDLQKPPFADLLKKYPDQQN